MWCLLIANVILGIDGGCFEHIEPLLKKNLLPNFKTILENGFHSKLQVTIPPATVPSWACSFSGLDTDQLGFFYFVHPTKGLFTSYAWRDYSIFSYKDLRTFVLNVPGTYPTWEINGEMIAGMMSPSVNSFPSELKSEIESNWIITGKNIKEVFKAFEIKKNFFLKKLKENFDLLIYVIKLPDSISHRATGSITDALNSIYRGYIKIDKFLGKILNNSTINNLIIFSDHGLKVYNYEFNIQRYFEKKGLLNIYDPKIKRISKTLFKLIDFIRPFIKNNPLFKYYRKFKKNQKRSIKKSSYTKKNKTYIQYYTGNVGGLFLKGKDRMKIDRIKKDLEKNKNVKRYILSKTEGFPDFFIILEDKFLLSKEATFYLKRKRSTISHKEIGFFMAYGKDIKKGSEDLVSFQNIAPTVLKLVNKQKPDYMRGSALNIFKED